MKSFIQHLKEFAQYSTSELVFNVSNGHSGGLQIPISGPMFKRLWPETIRTTVFHVADRSGGLKSLARIEGGKKSISAFFTMMSRYMEGGIATSGGIVAEMEADILVSASDDIMSQVDNKGRRWVSIDWFKNAQRYGTGPRFGMMEKELSKLISNLVVKHLSFEKLQSIRVGAGRDDFHVWADMKKHLSGDGKKLRLVIKDYFDGIEKVLKKHEDTMGSIFYGYARSKRQTEDSWDEQIVNNIKIKKVHVLEVRGYEDADYVYHDNIKSVGDWPIKEWDSSTELEIYTREVVAAERGK